jgi:hypothetical protein
MTIPDVYDIQTIDRYSYFVTAVSGLYKITNGVAEEFTVNNSVFRAYKGFVYDNTYIVYSGYRISDGKQQFMIYDNGAYTFYDQPQNDTSYLAQLLFAGKGEFYYTQLDSAKYYKFKNGIVTPYPYSGSFMKANGNIYLVSYFPDFTARMYKITDMGPQYLWTDPSADGIYKLTSDAIKLNLSTDKVSYFTEAGWQNIFTLPVHRIHYPAYMHGNSKNNFVVIEEDSDARLSAHVWDGTNYTKQTNIPPEANFDKALHYLSADYFIDNTFYMLVTYKIGSTKVFKATMK